MSNNTKDLDKIENSSNATTEINDTVDVSSKNIQPSENVSGLDESKDNKVLSETSKKLDNEEENNPNVSQEKNLEQDFFKSIGNFFRFRSNYSAFLFVIPFTYFGVAFYTCKNLFYDNKLPFSDFAKAPKVLSWAVSWPIALTLTTLKNSALGKEPFHDMKGVYKVAAYLGAAVLTKVFLPWLLIPAIGYTGHIAYSFTLGDFKTKIRNFLNKSKEFFTPSKQDKQKEKDDLQMEPVDNISYDLNDDINVPTSFDNNDKNANLTKESVKNNSLKIERIDVPKTVSNPDLPSTSDLSLGKK